MASRDNFEWNPNKAHASLGQVGSKKFDQRFRAHNRGEQPVVDQVPPPQPFHMGNGNFHWDVPTRYVRNADQLVEQNCLLL